MTIHRLNRVTIGVPDPAATGAFYRDFGLTETATGLFATVDGGDQLALVTAPRRRVIELELGCQDPDDLERLAAQVGALDLGLDVAVDLDTGLDTGLDTDLDPDLDADADLDAGVDADVDVAQAMDARRHRRSFTVTDPATQVAIRIVVAPPLELAVRTQSSFNSPGSYERIDARADGVLRHDPVRPRKLSHVVLGSIDADLSQRLFVDGLGFKVSDSVAGIGAFLRCSTEHHNVLIQNAPVPFLHHTSWQVDDVDEIGRGAAHMLTADPSRHVWGLGRHFIGSNFFWYLKDPAGNFAEYSSDIDVIIDDEIWKPGVWSGMKSLMAWGPPVPSAFIAPDDMADLIAAGAGRP